MAEFKLDYDYSLEGVKNVWEAHGVICAEAGIESAEIHNVEYIGETSNHLPILCITFSCIEVAAEYTKVYMGMSEIDEYVEEYVYTGGYLND
jgi:hypothetical protein